jgi:feruloyl esterase
MLIHGMSDPLFSAYDTARYYERVVRDNGGLDKTLPWVRYFEIPGMNHWGAKGKSFPGVSRPVWAIS